MKKVTPVTVTGRLLDHEGGPITGAKAMVYALFQAGPRRSVREQLGEAPTDGNGAFAVSALSGCSGRLRFYMRGSETDYIEDRNKIRFEPGFINLEDIQLPPLESSVAGQVVDEEGKPVPFANIVVDSIGQWSVYTETMADKSGRFSAERLPEGKLFICVFQLPPGYTPEHSPQLQVTVPAGTQDVRLVLSSGK